MVERRHLWMKNVVINRYTTYYFALVYERSCWIYFAHNGILDRSISIVVRLDKTLKPN